MSVTHCTNHPGVDAAGGCAHCLRPFCNACLVDFMGARYCGPCRDLRLAEMQQGGSHFSPESDGRLAGTGQVDIAGWLDGGWQLVKDDLPTFALAVLLAGALTLASCGVLAGSMACGLMMLCYKRMTDGRTDSSLVMAGTKRLGNAFLFMLGFALISKGVDLALDAIMEALVRPMFSNAEGRNAVASMLSSGLTMLFDIVLDGVTFFAIPLIAARNLSAADAVRESWKVFLRNPFGFCLTGFVFQLIAVLGVVLCGVGLLVTVPIAAAARARAYADHFGVLDWQRP